MEDEAGLFAEDPGETRMRVAEGIYADAGDEIEITRARSVVDVAALAAMQNQRITGVVLEQVLLFEIDDGCRSDGRHNSS